MARLYRDISRCYRCAPGMVVMSISPVVGEEGVVVVVVVSSGILTVVCQLASDHSLRDSLYLV